MNEIVQLMLSLGAGALLGLLFFQGLWATVSRLSQVQYPALWMMGSLVLRFGLVLAGFYLLGRYGGWQHILVGAVGLTLSRLVVSRRMRPQPNKKEVDV